MDNQQGTPLPARSRLEMLPPEMLELVLRKVWAFPDIHRLLLVCRTLTRSAKFDCFKHIRKINVNFFYDHCIQLNDFATCLDDPNLFGRSEFLETGDADVFSRRKCWEAIHQVHFYDEKPKKHSKKRQRRKDEKRRIN